ncbi:MAG: carbohydrate ABC transporter permease [Clostridiales bacterium]|nr:carbohydrate ABC transporter permease [Clostridiales bacterium]
MKNKPSLWMRALLIAVSLVWAVPLLWAVVTALKPAKESMLLNWPSSLTLENFQIVFQSAPFLQYGLNTVLIVAGILAIQLVTVTLGAYALACIDFRGKPLAVALIMVQIIIPADVLILPNYITLRQLSLLDTLVGVMVPFFASSMGLLLLRGAYKGIPVAIADAAKIDGANVWQTLLHVYIPSTRATYVAFAICSVSTHWNNFLWPMIVINSVEKRPLTVGLSLFAKASESGPMWAKVTAATLIVMLPLYVLFCSFQKVFVSSLVRSGIK